MLEYLDRNISLSQIYFIKERNFYLQWIILQIKLLLH